MAASTSKDRNPPILVRIQSIDIQHLDFSGGVGAVKNRHVTCVEASDLFLFVGCTSGTTYVFSRDSLKFLFVIPFKGGKVCSIASASDDTDVAIGSIRGKVSVYRISPSVHRNSASTTHEESFRHLFADPHHTDSEITEMQWSPNGKYLFIGDGRGIVSQIDIASLEEFPRPPASKVILKVNSRILQIDCVFPYLAISAIIGVYLCDLEKEDFTRVQTKKHKDIKSTGLCLKLVSDNNEEINLSRLFLFIGEVGSDKIYRCNMQGNIIDYKEVELSPMCRESVNVFDPKGVDCRMSEVRDVNFALGKLYGVEDGCMISALNDRLFILDSKSLNVLIWNEDFHRISTIKLISNYMFIWNGNKLDVVAFTQFRSYGEQLLTAGLTHVLERWITHTLNSIGWKETRDSTEETQVSEETARNCSGEESSLIVTFRNLMGDIDKDNQFCSFVTARLPFQSISGQENALSLQSMNKCEPTPNLVASSMENFMKSINEMKKHDNQHENDSLLQAPLKNYVVQIWKALLQFYVDVDATVPCLEFIDTELTLVKVMASAQTFLKQPQLVRLLEDMNSLQDMSPFDEIFNLLVQNLNPQFLEDIYELSEDDTGLNSMCFMSFNKCTYFLDWFKDIGVSAQEVFYDTILADAILLLIPLMTQHSLISMLIASDSIFNTSKLFCTWMVLTTFCNRDNWLPYGALLRTLQNQPLRFRYTPEDILSTIYKDLLRSDISLPVKYLHQFVTALICSSQSTNSRKKVFSSLLAEFPLKHWPRKERRERTAILFGQNTILIEIFKLALLEDGNSVELCNCGLPAVFGCARKSVPATQRNLEERILHFLMRKHYLASLPTNINESPVHLFAMKRCLFEPYLNSSYAVLLSDDLQCEMILRTGLCSLLRTFRYSFRKMNILIDRAKPLNELRNYCLDCNQTVIIPSEFKSISWDCIGWWIVEASGSIQNLISMVDNCDLNTKGIFSLKFYQLILDRDKLKKARHQDCRLWPPEENVILSSELSCAILH